MRAGTRPARRSTWRSPTAPTRCALRVRDDGPGSAEADLDGHGLLGMRERATIAGGTLRVGRSEQGGFAVESELPIPAAAK